MESQPVVDYIAEQLKAGHAAADIRAHLIARGWSEAVVDDAFARQPQAAKPKHAAAKKLRRGARPRVTKWSKRRRKQLAALAVVIILALVFYALFGHKAPKPVPNTVPPLTHQQQQTRDVNTLGGAVGQYVASNGHTLPTYVVPTPGGNSVVLCGTTCDSTTSQVSTLSAYKPAGVKIVPYAPGITAPDISTLYLVSGAKCAGTTVTDQKVTALSMVILYATQATSGLFQHCVSL